MVLPVKGFSPSNLILICNWLLLFANSARMGVIAGVAVAYTGME